MKRWTMGWLAAALVAGVLIPLAGCTAAKGGASGSAAERVYVKPGEHDPYYAFLSGGHSGQVYVYGIPSCRHITTIPVFTPEPASGYGVDEDSKAMLKGFTWGDAHHPGTRSSGRSRTFPPRTPARSRPRTPSTCSPPRGSRCRFRRAP